MNGRAWLVTRAVLTLIVIAGLAEDVYVHFDLASTYDAVRSSSISQGDLFRIEGVLAVLAGVVLLVRPRRYTAALALLVTAGGVAAVLVYRYVDVGTLGPLPNMYEPVWYPKKTQSAWAEGIAAVAALGLLIVMHVRVRTANGATRRTGPAVTSSVGG